MGCLPLRKAAGNIISKNVLRHPFIFWPFGNTKSKFRITIDAA